MERHYIKYHSVAQYAELLHITPKALNKRITRYTNTTPNDIIKNRIILETKRLLAHTPLSIKEISYELGYEDTSYFTRFLRNMPIHHQSIFALNTLINNSLYAGLYPQRGKKCYNCIHW